MVFQKRTSLVFKKLQVVRFYDAKRNSLIYLSYSDKVIDGSPKNALSAVPIMPWAETKKNGVQHAEPRFHDGRPELLFQIAAEAVAFAVNGGDDFRRVRRRFEVFANPTDSDVHGTVMRLQLAAGHFLQQFATGLDLARVFAEVQHGAEFAARQLVLFAGRADQRAA